MTFQHDDKIQFQVSLRFVAGTSGELNESELRMLCILLFNILGSEYYSLSGHIFHENDLPYLSFLVPVKNEFVTTISPAVHLK